MAEITLCIWYHADPGLEPQLRIWLVHVRDHLGYTGTLFRRDTGEKTTFMEMYALADPDALTRIEALAANQPWITRLQSQRRCEAFMPIFRSGVD